MELTTARLALRDLTLEDVPAVHSWASDPRMATYVAWGPNSEQDTQEFVATALSQQAQEPRTTWIWAIIHDDALVGTISLEPLGPGLAETGYAIRPESWGQGIATEATQAVAQFAFAEAGVHRLQATCRPANDASARVLEKSGFTHETTMRGHMLVRGQWEDSLLYARLATDEPARSRIEACLVPRGLGDDLLLAPIHPRHAPAWSALVETHRAHLGQWIGWAHEDVPLERALADISRMRRMALQRPAMIAFAVLRGGQMVGFAALFDIRSTPGSAEVGYLVTSASSGHGIATRAVDELCRIGFDEIGLHRITVRAAVDNLPSRRVADKAGFELEGILRDAWQVDGQRQDLATYARLARRQP